MDAENAIALAVDIDLRLIHAQQIVIILIRIMTFQLDDILHGRAIKILHKSIAQNFAPAAQYVYIGPDIFA